MGRAPTPEPTTSTASDPWASLPPRIVLAGVLVLAALVYLPTFGFGFVYDDHWTILANGFLRCPEELALLFSPEATALHVPDAFRPTAVVVDMASYQLFGAHAHWHHLLSVLLHVGVCALFWRWLAARGTPLPLTAGAVALFAVLGIHAEAVAVVSYREDLLAAALGLAAMHAADRAAFDERHPARALLLAALLQALACGAKTSAVPLPLVWALSIALWPHALPDRRRVALPFVALALGTLLALAEQRHVVGALSPYDAQLGIHSASWSLATRLAASVQIHLGYLQQLVLPVGLSPEYVDRPAAWSDAATLLGAAAFALALGYALVCVQQRRAKAWSFVALALVCLWLPTSNVVPIPNMRADRFAYLPSIVVCIGFAHVLLALGDRALARRSVAWSFAPLALALVVQGALAQAAATAYKSDARLWEVALRREPGSARAQALVGELRIAQLRAAGVGERDEGEAAALARAEAYCVRAIQLGPDDALPRLCAARLAVQRKEWSRARDHFEAGLARARAREDRILTALASVTLDVPELPYPARKAEAAALIDRALREFPYASEVAAAGGRLRHRMGDAEGALVLYARARKLRPERWDVVLWGLELALDLGHSSAAWAIWAGAEDLLPDADPRLVDAARRRLHDGLWLFPTPPTDALPLADLIPKD